ncbi:hypothetical protein Ssi03_65080 [Sphaerisporangium siamense]|nr:hypothetical protein Ssi03_65080 [Sphaerisporangium siamense]
MYAEATARVRAAGKGRPEVLRLAEIIERLGAMADHIRVGQPPAREPVPDWLADRLIRTVGMSRETSPLLVYDRRLISGLSIGQTRGSSNLPLPRIADLIMRTACGWSCPPRGPGGGG